MVASARAPKHQAATVNRDEITKFNITSEEEWPPQFRGRGRSQGPVHNQSARVITLAADRAGTLRYLLVTLYAVPSMIQAPASAERGSEVFWRQPIDYMDHIIDLTVFRTAARYLQRRGH